MKIINVKRIKRAGRNMDGLEVEVEHNKKEYRMCFTDADEMLRKENGQEKFKKILKMKVGKEKKEVQDDIQELTEFKGVEL